MHWLRPFWVASLVLAVGCDDHIFPGEGGEEEGFTADYDGVQEFFALHCETCHPAVQPFELSQLEDDITNGTEQWVVAGDAAGSEIWQRVANTGEAPVMPPTGALAQDQVSHIQEWINAGASLE